MCVFQDKITDAFIDSIIGAVAEAQKCYRSRASGQAAGKDDLVAKAAEARP